ncbi:MAG TPA: amidohydrolase family protein [Stellaceae bacterium]|jgi:predicted TIM-barrel fold metal-dependent hydrolase|nr:amidohydrolase family protein [Stellaceae bacterium]
MVSAPHRIDVHHHISPPGYIAALDPQGILTRETLEWTPSLSLDQMDKGGVQVALTSITTPGLWFGDAAASRKLARLCNDYAAKLVADHPKRFGMFVNLPMPDIDASLKEIEYGLDVLKADGIVFFTSYGDKWLGDPAFDPVFEELNRRKAVVYTHPTSAACCTNLLKGAGIGDSIIEYGTDTTRCIAQIVLSGRAARFADIRFIWSHGGGTMPFLLVRFTRASRGQFKKNVPNGFVHEARRFYYDTAAVYARAPLLALREVVTVDQIVFGTDVPWGDPAEIAKEVIEAGVFTEEELRKIDRGNALRILPQFR